MQVAGRKIVWFQSVGSTMDEAERLALEGCPSGTVVGAEEQTAGQGRYGRRWHSERGTGLYVSIVLRPGLDPADLPILTLALGLAVAEAITSTTGLACDLRWPNDVLLGNRKCAGILVQRVEDAVVAGIGINVNQTAFPAELARQAVSLRMVSGRVHSREALLEALLEKVDESVNLLAERGKEPILEAFSRASSYVRGRRVQVDLEHSRVTGTTDGLDPCGFLLLKTDGGLQTLIRAGGVRPAQANSCS